MNNLETCVRCEQAKESTEFYADKRNRSGLMAACRMCHIRGSRAWAKRNPVRVQEINRAYKDRHPEKLRARSRERNKTHKEDRQRIWQNYYAANRERLVAAAAAYRLANPEKVKAVDANWRKNNPELSREKGRRRYARKRAAFSDLALDQWQEILAEFGHACAYCLRSDVALTMDHLEPFARGGEHTASNVVPACGSCNSRKQAKDLLSFLVGERRAA